MLFHVCTSAQNKDFWHVVQKSPNSAKKSRIRKFTVNILQVLGLKLILYGIDIKILMFSKKFCRY